MMNGTRCSVLAVAILAAGAISASSAQAQNADCTTLANPVYFPATTLLDSYLAKVLPVLADPAEVGAAEVITVIHFPLSSCIAYDTFKDSAVVSGTGIYYAPLADGGGQLACDMPGGSTIEADMAAMDVGGIACLGGVAPPADLVEFPAHVETLGFVVPRNSSQTAITATEGYHLMKYGGGEGFAVAPWTDPNTIHVRTGGSSTQLTIGASIGQPGTMWSSELVSHQGSGGVRDAIIAANSTGNAEKTLGILNSSKWEAATADIKILAFQAFNNCFGAVFPDSTSVARDKRNVRDGHYPIWTNLRYIARQAAGDIVSPNGVNASARVARFIDLMTGVQSLPALNVSQAVIETGNIPACAMHVQREVDGGDMSPFEHPAPCDCFFVEQNGGTSGCASCDVETPCATGTCRDGFCEAR